MMADKSEEVMWNRYFVPDDGETVEDAISFQRYSWFKKVHVVVQDEDAESYADDAAIDHYNSSSCECGLRFRIAVVNTNDEVKLFDVEIEFDPVASVSEVDQTDETEHQRA